VKIVNIQWDVIPFNQAEIAQLNTKKDKGVYQIYGRHNAYGKNALLYIGQADNFSVRLKNRYEFVESSATPTMIRVGRIVTSTVAGESLDFDITEWDHIINLVEELLIRAHSPALNQKNNKGLAEHEILENCIHVLNWGDFGDLLPEVSTIKNSFKYWHFEKALEKNNS
jgi:hypothetical protein